jgi:hypothetical protein
VPIVQERLERVLLHETTFDGVQIRNEHKGISTLDMQLSFTKHDENDPNYRDQRNGWRSKHIMRPENPLPGIAGGYRPDNTGSNGTYPMQPYVSFWIPIYYSWKRIDPITPFGWISAYKISHLATTTLV